jgi:hypothetical protein
MTKSATKKNNKSLTILECFLGGGGKNFFICLTKTKGFF